MHATLPLLIKSDFPAICRGPVETLQINLGYRCNQSCMHCHVDAGPKRTEAMNDETIEAVFEALARRGIGRLDLTGGAPEMHPRFRDIVRRARGLGVWVTDRCNLTILEEPGYEGLAEFLAEQEVSVIASMPCYLEENVDAQRGKGVYELSIAGLRRLNALGYGTGRELTLVYNPGGAFLPPDQNALEADYRHELRTRHGIVFTRLIALANMPIHRFGSTLVSEGQFDDYLRLLREAHRAQNLERVMCRSLISVDWQGRLYDCDFNQMLGLPLGLADGSPARISDLGAADLEGLLVTVADHCYGCTAGQGSSCGGALSG